MFKILNTAVDHSSCFIVLTVCILSVVVDKHRGGIKEKCAKTINLLNLNKILGLASISVSITEQ